VKNEESAKGFAKRKTFNQAHKKTKYSLSVGGGVRRHSILQRWLGKKEKTNRTTEVRQKKKGPTAGKKKDPLINLKRSVRERVGDAQETGEVVRGKKSVDDQLRTTVVPGNNPGAGGASPHGSNTENQGKKKELQGGGPLADPEKTFT